ncbi:MAG TPA: PAS domain-containing protein [Dyadobacter sp.]|jgi:PAS domain S-box-containing protein|nr:PAS domain-containing protein [Dyadobacter sp.]
MSVSDQPNYIFSEKRDFLDTEYALQAAGLGAWEMDVKNQTIWWDAQCARLFGSELSNPISYENALRNVLEEDIPALRSATWKVLSSNDDECYEVACRIKKEDDNDIRWIRFTGRSTVNPAGEIVRFAGIAQDITRDVHQQQQVERNEQSFRALIQNAPFAMGVYTSRSLIIDIANPAMIRVWGKTDDVIGTRLAEALPELEGQPFIAILENVFDTGIAYSSAEQEVKLVVDGELRSYWFNFTYEPLINAENEVYAILNMAVDVSEKFKARKAAEDSRNQLLASFEQAPVAIAVITPKNLVFEMANQFYCDLVGRTRDQLVGKPLAEALPELDGQGFDDLLNGVINTGIPYTAPEVPVQLRKKNKLEKLYVDLTYQPQYDDDGIISGVLVVATDVTQQVTARQRIEHSETKLKSIVSNAPAAMAVFMGRDLVIDHCNQAFIEIIGKEPDVTGRPLRDVMPELEGQPFLQILDNVFTSGTMYQSYASQVDVNNHGTMTHGFYNITYTPLFNDDGEVYAILEIAIDVTEEVLAKQRIEEGKEFLAGAVELAEMAVWSFDIKANRFNFSPRFRSWLGFSEDTQSVEDTYDALPDAFRDIVALKLQDAMRPGSSGIYQNEHPVINKLTGQQRIIHAQAKVFFDEDGKPAQLSGTAIDVTAQRELQAYMEFQIQERTEELAASNEELAATNEEFAATNEDLADANNMLIRSNQNLEQFAYVASHDLQEPLRKIRQFGDLLSQHYENPSPSAKMYLERMQSAASRMSVLIEDLLTFARISSHKEELKPVHLENVIQNVLSDLELRVLETNAIIEISPLPVVYGDQGQLEQLFMNLLSNSLKFIRDSVTPQVSIRYELIPHTQLPFGVKPLKWAAQYHRIECSDNGFGFDQKYSERIFQVFQRLHGRSEYSGTGIGLAICEKVVTSHGGAITASSENANGAKFTVYLPWVAVRS